MPFPQQNIRRNFNRTTVESLNPNQHGVYGLCRGETWIYIGKGDIRQRLLDHLNGDIPCIIRAQPTHWIDEVTHDADELERQLILELTPLCNQRVG